MSGRPEIRNNGNSSKELAAAEIPAARSVQEVLAGGGFSALLSQHPEVVSNEKLEGMKLERMKEEVSYKKKEKKNPGLRGFICGRNSLEVSNSTGPAELGL